MMMTSWHENAFRITGTLCGESTSDRPEQNEQHGACPNAREANLTSMGKVCQELTTLNDFTVLFRHFWQSIS